MQKTAAMKRAGAVMGVTIAVLCVLLVAFSYYHATRATISPYGELSLWDTIEMCIRDSYKAVLYAQQRKYVKMLHRLRHEAFVRRNHKHCKIYSARARKHVLYELFVPRHVHYARLRAVRPFNVRKAELYCYAALFLLCQAVRLYAGERFYKRCLAVVNMARGAYYNEMCIRDSYRNTFQT